MRIGLLIAAAGLALMPGLAMAGVVYEIETTDHGSSPPRVEKNSTYAEGKLLKMGVDSKKPGSKGEMIYRGDAREMVIVDHENDSFMVIGGKTMIASLGGAPTGPLTGSGNVIRKTAEHAEKAGYPCVKYEVLRGGTVIRELWVTDWANVPGADELRAVALEAAQFYKSSIPGGAVMDMGLLDDLASIGGFPVATRTFKGGGAVEKESLLSSATKRALQPSDFEPPAGYKRREMFGR